MGCGGPLTVLTVSTIALGVGACGGRSEPTSPTATQARSSTTAEAQRPPVDAATLLGATLTTATAGEPGVVVQSVQAGRGSFLKRGDVIVAYNDTPVATAADLIRRIGTPKVGDRFRIRVVRGSKRFTLLEVQSPTVYLGAKVKDGAPGAHGAIVESVAAGSPAAGAHLQHGDVITAIDAAPVGRAKELLQILGTHRSGDKITLELARGSRRLKAKATLVPRPIPGTGG